MTFQGWFAFGLLAIMALAAPSPALAQATERHIAPGAAPPAEPAAITPTPLVEETDDRPMGVVLKAVVLIGADDALVADHAAQGVDSSRISPPENSDLARDLQAFVGRPLSRKLIADIQTVIVQHYRHVRRPFVFVSPPPQDVTNGVLQLRVVTFKLGQRQVTGANDAQSDVAAIRIKSGDEISADQLQEDLNWLNHSPFRRVSATFKPGVRSGETDLDLHVARAQPWSVFAEYSNSGTQSSGENRWSLGAQAGEFIAPGSVLGYQMTTSDDFWVKDGKVFDKASDPEYLSHSLVLLAPLAARQELSVITNYVETRASTPDFTFRFRTAELTALYRTAVSNFLRLPGDFSAGVELRTQRAGTFFGDTLILDSIVDVGQFTVAWQHDWWSSALRQRVAFTLHVSPGDLSSHNHDGDFINATNGRVERADYSIVDIDYAADVLLPRGWRYSSTFRAQLADRPLLNTEQISLGGENATRSYLYDDGAFDEGAIWRNELHAPEVGPLHTLPYVFLDGGYGRDQSETDAKQWAASAGVGVDQPLMGNVSFMLVAGWSLVEAAASGRGSSRILAKIRTSF